MAEEVLVPNVYRRIRRTTVIANLAGAVVLYAYLQFVAPGAYRKGSITGGVVSLIVLIGYVAAAVVICLRVLTPDEMTEGPRDDVPSAEAVDTVLRAPTKAAVWVFGAWFVGIPIFVIMNLFFRTPAGSIARIGVGILLGGLMTSAATYLIVERELRGLVSTVLAGVPDPDRPGPGIRAQLLLGWALGSGVPLVAIALTPFERARQVNLSVPIVFLSVTGLVAGTLIMRSVASRVSEPLGTIRAVVAKVGGGSLDVEVPVDDSGEIGQLEAGINRMIAGLKERQRLHDLFGRHVGESVARLALSREIALGGEMREASVLFVDLIGSTALATSMPAPEVVNLLNTLFSCIVRAVDEEVGLVNKFEGDAALCIFGVPVHQPDHAARALRAARTMHALLLDEARRHPGLDAAIGVSSGQVVAGNVGALNRFEYTVIGDPVNEAARLTELAKTLPGRIAASADVVAWAGPGEQERWSDCGERTLRGRSRPTGLMVPGDSMGSPSDPSGTARR